MELLEERENRNKKTESYQKLGEKLWILQDIAKNIFPDRNVCKKSNLWNRIYF